MNASINALQVTAWRIGIVIVCFVVWQWGFELRSSAAWLVPDVLDPYFISRPSDIWARFLDLGCLRGKTGAWLIQSATSFNQCLDKNENNLWIALFVTLKNTFGGFFIGVSSGYLVGLALGRSRLMAQVLEPFIVAFNSIPRIALVPLIVLMFGLGDASKIVTAWVIVFFVVFFNTYEGAKQIDQDHVSVARMLGASQWQITVHVVIPSTLVWMVASLTPSISFSLIGVIVGEFIGSERGLGRIIIESEGRGDASAMMVAIFMLMIVGVVLAQWIQKVQQYLLRWQPRYAGV